MTTAAAQESIKVGVLTIRSGPGAPVGDDILSGIQTATRMQGPVLGRPIELVLEDSLWNPQQAVSHTIFDQATEKREPRLPRERIPELGLHEAFLFFRGRPTLVALVYYFLPAAVALRNVAKVLPSLLRSPQQPVAFGEYQLSLQIAAMSGSRTEKRVQDGTRDGVLTPESKKPRSTRSKTGTKQTP